jgi:hypothetical protein
MYNYRFIFKYLLCIAGLFANASALSCLALPSALLCLALLCLAALLGLI